MTEIESHLKRTQNYHRQVGSTGFSFAYLIDGPIKPDIPFGDQMSAAALQTYYNSMLKQTRDVSATLGFLPTQAALPLIQVIGGFEMDLDYLEDKGFDVSAARTELKSLNPRLQALLPEE